MDAAVTVKTPGQDQALSNSARQSSEIEEGEDMSMQAVLTVHSIPDMFTSGQQVRRGLLDQAQY